MSALNEYSIRDAGLFEGDEAFVVSVFDASLPYLESIGSPAQWGSIQFSQRPGWIEETQRQIQESERNRLSDTTDALRNLFVEAGSVEQAVSTLDLRGMHSRITDDGRYFVSLGFVFVHGNWFPTYLPAATTSGIKPTELEGSLYIEVMVSDNRTKHLFSGTGAALIQGVRDFGRNRGKETVFLDGWAGNGGKLIR